MLRQPETPLSGTGIQTYPGVFVCLCVLLISGSDKAPEYCYNGQNKPNQTGKYFAYTWTGAKGQINPG